MNEQLGRRAVACKGWQWMSGMAWTCGQANGRISNSRDVKADGLGALFCRVHLSISSTAPTLPNLDDPATLGCLLHLVREASGDPLCSTDANQSGDWTVYGCLPTIKHHRNTEAEALVEALESLEGRSYV